MVLKSWDRLNSIPSQRRTKSSQRPLGIFKYFTLHLRTSAAYILSVTTQNLTLGEKTDWLIESFTFQFNPLSTKVLWYHFCEILIP